MIKHIVFGWRDHKKQIYDGSSPKEKWYNFGWDSRAWIVDGA